MGVKYSVRSIRNASGAGKERKYVSVRMQEAKSENALGEYIESGCSLTAGDVRAALSALRGCMVAELSGGSRFHIPGIGYFSINAAMAGDASLDGGKIRGGKISVGGIRFLPERSLLAEVDGKTRFEYGGESMLSKNYSEAGLAAAVREYLSRNPCITRRAMCMEFGLREGMALKWIRRFVESGLLRKAGASNSPVYVLGG